MNILGIVVPTIEAATGLPWEHEAQWREEKAESSTWRTIFWNQ